jgi:hypothetical protein
MIKNIEQLRNELASTIEMIKGDPKFVRQACEINNGCGKMLKSVQVELEAAALCKIKPSIRFLKY